MPRCWACVLLISLLSHVCPGAELDPAEVMVINAGKNEDTLDRSWSSDDDDDDSRRTTLSLSSDDTLLSLTSDDSVVSLTSDADSRRSDIVFSLDSDDSSLLSLCSSESCDESEE